MSYLSNFSGGANNLTFLNQEQGSLKNSLRVSGDIEKQGSLAYEELEDQKNLLSVNLFYIKLFRI